MKRITNSLLLAALCFITLFSCGENSSNASVDGDEKSTVQKGVEKSSNQLTKKEVLDKMNEANLDKSKKAEAVDMVKEIKSGKMERLGEGQAEQSSVQQRRRYEKVKDLPATEQQKKTADDICKCLNKNPLFNTVMKTKSSDALIKTLGDDRNNEVRTMQNCYNNIMVPAVKGLGKDAGNYSKKSREYLTNTCLNGRKDFFSNLGAYLTRKRLTVDPNDLPENQ